MKTNIKYLGQDLVIESDTELSDIVKVNDIPIGSFPINFISELFMYLKTYSQMTKKKQIDDLVYLTNLNELEARSL